MKHFLGLLVLLSFVAMAPSAMATDGKTLLYGGGGEGRVTFDGQLHAAKGYVCNDCHLKLFTTQKKGLITAGDHKTDTLCFACHNGQIAFKKCAGCHRDLSEPVAHAQPATTATVATPPAIVPLIYEGATTIGKSFVPVK